MKAQYITRFGSAGNQPGQFQAVESIAINGSGQVYIGDFSNIKVFSSDGRYLKPIDIPEGAPFGIAFDDLDNLFVSNRTKIYELAAQ